MDRFIGKPLSEVDSKYGHAANDVDLPSVVKPHHPERIYRIREACTVAAQYTGYPGTVLSWRYVSAEGACEISDTRRVHHGCSM